MIRPAPYQHFSAGGMSLLVHGLFIAFLLFGVSWRSLPHVPVEAELWRSLPQPLPPLPVPAPINEVPPPVEPTPPAPPPAERPLPAKPDIALEQAEKKRQEAESLRLKEEARKAAEQERLAREAVTQAEKRRQEQLQRERERKLVEQDLARQAQEELDAESVQLRGSVRTPPVDGGRQARLVGESQDRIRSKILGYLRLPPNLLGNPEVVFKVALLPNGEVVNAQLLRGSGQPAYDREMERAILKASPLPLPSDREAAASFRDGLILKFRPREDAQAGR